MENNDNNNGWQNANTYTEKNWEQSLQKSA